MILYQPMFVDIILIVISFHHRDKSELTKTTLIKYVFIQCDHTIEYSVQEYKKNHFDKKVINFQKKSIIKICITIYRTNKIHTIVLYLT